MKNMREIKYRVFDPEQKEWIYCEPFDDEINEYVFRIFQDYPETRGQFTGLLDKNGTPIYAGDIMRYLAIYPADFQKEHPYKKHNRINNGVSWSNKWSSWMADTTYERDEIFLGFGENEQWEVIGNIYENPELLT